ncbi:MAG: hypothetical protein IJ568_05710, partial [Bacilli bacterium]|nr:hypothetical protein [Bacilli bacterium]
ELNLKNTTLEDEKAKLTKEVEELNLKNTTLEDEKAKLTKEVEELNLKLEEVTKTSDKENKK